MELAILIKFQTGNSTDSSSSTSESFILITAGSVGGAALFIISCLLCIIILLVRQSRKETVRASNKMATEMSSDIKMNTNPSYDISKEEQEHQYDYVTYNQLDNNHDNIKMDTNPSYGRVQCNNNNIPTIQENPSYKIFQGTHNTRDENKDACITQEAEHVKVVGSTTKEKEARYDDINITPNPSYNSMSGGIKLVDNPSYS